ncbi:hypothetical protein [Rossellomorea sp. NPDC077527]
METPMENGRAETPEAFFAEEAWPNVPGKRSSSLHPLPYTQVTELCKS